MEAEKEVQQVGAFGERLRREREMRGVSLDEIVATTKIGRRLLVALEEEQFDLLPGGIFNKSYVRAYAKCIGIDEDAAVAEYMEAAREEAPEPKVIAHQHAFHSDRQPERAGFPVLPVLILLVVAAGAAGGWTIYQQHRRDRAAAKPPDAVATVPETAPPTTAPAESPSATATSLASAQVPASTQPSTPSAGAPAQSTPAPTPSATNKPETTAASGPFEITVRPKDRAWVSIKADGNYVVRGIIKPPDVKTIRAAKEVIFYTGNAGNVEVAFNGKNVPVASGGNEPQVLVFNSQGVLQRAPAQ